MVGVHGERQAPPSDGIVEPFTLPDLKDRVAGLGLRLAHRPERFHAVQGGFPLAGDVQRPQAQALQLDVVGGLVMLKERSPLATRRQALQPLPEDALGTRQVRIVLSKAVDLSRAQTA